MAKEIMDWDLNHWYEVAIRHLAQLILDDMDSTYIYQFISVMSTRRLAYKAIYRSFRAQTQDLISDEEFAEIFPFSEEELSIEKYTCYRKHVPKYKILVINLPSIGLTDEYKKIYYIYDDAFTIAFGGFRTLEKLYEMEAEGIFIYKNPFVETPAEFTAGEYINVNGWFGKKTGFNVTLISSNRKRAEYDDLYKIMCFLMNDTNPKHYSIKPDEDSI